MSPLACLLTKFPQLCLDQHPQQSRLTQRSAAGASGCARIIGVRPDCYPTHIHDVSLIIDSVKNAVWSPVSAEQFLQRRVQRRPHSSGIVLQWAINEGEQRRSNASRNRVEVSPCRAGDLRPVVSQLGTPRRLRTSASPRVLPSVSSCAAVARSSMIPGWLSQKIVSSRLASSSGEISTAVGRDCTVNVTRCWVRCTSSTMADRCALASVTDRISCIPRPYTR